MYVSYEPACYVSGKIRVMTNLKRMVGTNSHRSFQNDLLILISDSQSREARTEGKEFH